MGLAEILWFMFLHSDLITYFGLSSELLPSAEQNALSNSSTVDPNCRQEGKRWKPMTKCVLLTMRHHLMNMCHILGDSGLPDRQASPEKLYRAALLRSRFADIIIKAQEKSIEKVWNLHILVKMCSSLHSVPALLWFVTILKFSGRKTRSWETKAWERGAWKAKKRRSVFNWNCSHLTNLVLLALSIYEQRKLMQ